MPYIFAFLAIVVVLVSLGLSIAFVYLFWNEEREKALHFLIYAASLISIISFAVASEFQLNKKSLFIMLMLISFSIYDIVVFSDGSEKYKNSLDRLENARKNSNISEIITFINDVYPDVEGFFYNASKVDEIVGAFRSIEFILTTKQTDDPIFIDGLKLVKDLESHSSVNIRYFGNFTLESVDEHLKEEEQRRKTESAIDHTRKTIIKRAKKRVVEAESIVDAEFTVEGNCIVWDLASNRYHSAHRLDENLRFSNTENPITVILVSEQSLEMKGFYNISGKRAYLARKNVYVVKFQNGSDDGEGVSVHTIVGDDPRKKRPVQDHAEAGGISWQVTNWIDSKCKK